MLNRFKLETRLIIIGMLIASAPLLAIAIVVWQQTTTVGKIAEEETAKLATADLTHIVQGVYSLAASQQEVLQQSVNSTLNVSEHLLSQSGGLVLGQDQTTWSAANQFTSQVMKVELPKLYVGGNWLGQNTSMREETAIVDEVQRLVGGTSTIFQRMNKEGDML